MTGICAKFQGRNRQGATESEREGTREALCRGGELGLCPGIAHSTLSKLSYVLETVSLVLISKCLVMLILLAEPAGHSLTEIIPSSTASLSLTVSAREVQSTCSIKSN